MTNTPPTARTDLWQGVTDGAWDGVLRLPVCGDCGTIQYPPRDICMSCLGRDVAWQEVAAEGTLLAETDVHISLDPWFGERAPWPVCMVQLVAGPVVMAHRARSLTTPGAAIRLVAVCDPGGQGVMVAVPAGADIGGKALEQLVAL